MADKIVCNPDDDKFISLVKKMTKGDYIEVTDGKMILEYDLKETTQNFQQKQNFPFHQRIFEAGVILKKEGSNTRIFISKERLDEVE